MKLIFVSSLVALGCEAAPIKIIAVAAATAALSSAATMGALRLMGEASPIERIEAPLQASPIEEVTQPFLASPSQEETSPVPHSDYFPIFDPKNGLPIWWEAVLVSSVETWQEMPFTLSKKDFNFLISILVQFFEITLNEMGGSSIVMERLDVIKEKIEEGDVFGLMNLAFLAMFREELLEAVARAKLMA
jgi:hypothetical protein